MSAERGSFEPVLSRLLVIAESDPEREVCGFVLARLDGPPEVVALRNVASDPERGFCLAPADVLRVMRAADEDGRALAALFHSHPSGGAALSSRDIQELSFAGGALLPGVELWVLGMVDGRVTELRAYDWAEGGFEEVACRRAPFTLREDESEGA